MTTLVVDYQLNNLRSICRALEECQQRVVVSSDPADLKQADRVILPGVGAFAKAMEQLERLGWVEPLRENQKPLLGICLGMQLLADEGSEGGKVRGLALIPGKVVKMEGERIPHVGWNEIDRCEHPLFHSIPSKTDFYFVHSYQFIPKEKKTILARTPYASTFVSAMGNGNTFGVQFHPEKSMPAGLTLLKNFCEESWD